MTKDQRKQAKKEIIELLKEKAINSGGRYSGLGMDLFKLPSFNAIIESDAEKILDEMENNLSNVPNMFSQSLSTDLQDMVSATSNVLNTSNASISKAGWKSNNNNNKIANKPVAIPVEDLDQIDANRYVNIAALNQLYTVISQEQLSKQRDGLTNNFIQDFTKLKNKTSENAIKLVNKYLKESIYDKAITELIKSNKIEKSDLTNITKKIKTDKHNMQKIDEIINIYKESVKLLSAALLKRYKDYEENGGKQDLNEYNTGKKIDIIALLKPKNLLSKVMFQSYTEYKNKLNYIRTGSSPNVSFDLSKDITTKIIKDEITNKLINIELTNLGKTIVDNDRQLIEAQLMSDKTFLDKVQNELATKSDSIDKLAECFRNLYMQDQKSESILFKVPGKDNVYRFKDTQNSNQSETDAPTHNTVYNLPVDNKDLYTAKELFEITQSIDESKWKDKLKDFSVYYSGGSRMINTKTLDDVISDFKRLMSE